MYSESQLISVAQKNNLPANASILNFNRDEERTSEKYRPTDDVAIVETLNELGWYITNYQQRKAHDASRNIYKKYLATYSNNSLPDIQGLGKLTIIERNSKDGVSSNQFFAGFLTFACLNGMIVGNQLFEPLTIRHKGNIPLELNKIVGSLADKLPLIGERVAEMASIKLTEPQAIEFAKEAINLRFGDEVGKGVNPVDVLRARREADNTLSLFHVLNRVQENLFKSDGLKIIKSDGKQTTSRRLRNIDVSVKVNTGLWDIAESYLIH